MGRRLTALTLAAVMPAACAPADFSRPGPIASEASYDALYPTYAELCAVSGVHKLPGFGAEISGGPGGHSVLFLRGACRVEDAHYPVLRACDQIEPGGADGVGLSVNAHFSNANWVVTAGRDFFFDGGLRPDETLTRDAYERTQRQAQRFGILDGVRFHDAVFADKPPGMSREDYKYEVSVSTDYAVSFGRGRYCARVPLTRAQMSRMVDFLNRRNALYRDGPAEYRWNVLGDNCAHLTHNALAAVGVWDERRVNGSFLFSTVLFPVPKNEFVNLVRRGNDTPLTDLRALYDDTLTRDALLRDDWMAMQPGTIATSAPVHGANGVYDNQASLIFYEDPVFGDYQPRFERATSEPRYHDLNENRRFFAALYERVRTDRRSLEWWLARDPSLATGSFARFYERFYAYVDRQLDALRSGPGTSMSTAAGAGHAPG